MLVSTAVTTSFKVGRKKSATSTGAETLGTRRASGAISQMAYVTCGAVSAGHVGDAELDHGSPLQWNFDGIHCVVHFVVRFEGKRPVGEKRSQSRLVGKGVTLGKRPQVACHLHGDLLRSLAKRRGLSQRLVIGELNDVSKAGARRQLA